MGFFRVKKITPVQKLKDGEIIPESDYSLLTNNDEFVQFEYVREDDKLEPYKVHPGIYSIAKSLTGYVLQPTAFTNEKLLEEYVYTKDITDKIDKFFSKVHIYEKHGMSPARRGVLLYGSPGGGKSSILNKISQYYNNLGRTTILLWHTDKFDASEVKDFIKSFVYEGVDRFILVAEDIGGVEIDEVRMRSDSSLLSLLDNVEKTFTIPTLILATTNHPEIFLGNLTNRPQRFDDKIEVKPPTAEFRAKFLSFFTNGTATEVDLDKIKQNKYNEFSVAHIKEIVIRSEIYDLSYSEAMDQIFDDTQKFKKGFQDKRNVGFGLE